MKVNNYHTTHYFSFSFTSYSLLSHRVSLSNTNLEEKNQTKIHYFRQNQTQICLLYPFLFSCFCVGVDFKYAT